MKKFLAFSFLLFFFVIIGSPFQNLYAYPEYSAFSGSNCMACHVGPTGGFGRKPVNTRDTGWISDKFFMSGDLLFMGLYDQRSNGKNRVVLFPMEGSLHFAFLPKSGLTISASQDFGMLRELYGMLQNEAQTLYARAGFFTLPYGILFGDHTAFVKEGRVKSGARTFEEKGAGAGLFGVRYKDSGVEAGYSGKVWFANLAMTSGVVGQESRAFPSSQSGTKKAFTRRGGFITKNVSLGASMYTNDNEAVDRRILRYGVFGWFRGGPAALLFEHDEGEEEQFNVSGSTQITASYAELVFNFSITEKKWPSFAKVRYERLDPNRSLEDDLLERWILSYRFAPLEYLSVETFYRNNRETPSVDNDDVFVITHLFF